MTNHAHPPDGLNALANGVLHRSMMKDLGFGLVGCIHRGRVACMTLCRWQPVQLCDWKCDTCDSRALCKCGHNNTDLRVEGWVT